MSAFIKTVALVVPVCCGLGPAVGRSGSEASMKIAKSSATQLNRRKFMAQTAFLAAGSALGPGAAQPASADCNCGTCEKAAQQVVDDLQIVIRQHPGLWAKENPSIPGSGSLAHLYGYCQNLATFVEDTSPGKPSLVNWLGDSEQGKEHPVVRAASNTLKWLGRDGKQPLCAPYVPGLYSSVKHHGGCHLNPHSSAGVKQTWQYALTQPSYPLQMFGKWVDGRFGPGVYNEHKFYNRHFGYLPSLQIQDELLVYQLIRDAADCQSCKLGTTQKTQTKQAADINEALAKLSAGDGAVPRRAPTGWLSKLKLVRP